MGHPGLVKDKIMWRRMLKLFIQKNKLMTEIKYVNVCLSKLRVCPLKVSAKNVILIKTSQCNMLKLMGSTNQEIPDIKVLLLTLINN